jgi:hypothetical protein
VSDYELPSIQEVAQHLRDKRKAYQQRYGYAPNYVVFRERWKMVDCTSLLNGTNGVQPVGVMRLRDLTMFDGLTVLFSDKISESFVGILE